MSENGRCVTNRCLVSSNEYEHINQTGAHMAQNEQGRLTYNKCCDVSTECECQRVVWSMNVFKYMFPNSYYIGARWDAALTFFFYDSRLSSDLKVGKGQYLSPRRVVCPEDTGPLPCRRTNRPSPTLTPANNSSPGSSMVRRRYEPAGPAQASGVLTLQADRTSLHIIRIYHDDLKRFGLIMKEMSYSGTPHWYTWPSTAGLGGGSLVSTVTPSETAGMGLNWQLPCAAGSAQTWPNSDNSGSTFGARTPMVRCHAILTNEPP